MLELPYSSLLSELYNPKALVAHAASLRQGCPHCAIFLTAASRRSLGRISVPMWPITLSGRLPIAVLVGHYPTNKLMGRGLILVQKVKRSPPLPIRPEEQIDTSGINPGFPGLSRTLRKITHVLLTRLRLVYPSKLGPYRSTCMFKTRRQR